LKRELKDRETAVRREGTKRGGKKKRARQPAGNGVPNSETELSQEDIEAKNPSLWGGEKFSTKRREGRNPLAFGEVVIEGSKNQIKVRKGVTEGRKRRILPDYENKKVAARKIRGKEKGNHSDPKIRTPCL